jgi:23S rRNA (pseudouridine1915-N3)-methyltransferase
MRLRLIEIGKTEAKYFVEAESVYENRLKHYVKFERITLSDVKNGGSLPVETLKEKEGSLIISKLQNNDYVILLDEKGQEYSSRNFANWISKLHLSVSGNVVFVIGGAFGFSEEIYKRANHQISLSKMTFSHQMVRVFFLEQLYRCFSILNGSKYHHD